MRACLETVELTPAFVERRPQRYGRAVVKSVDDLVHLLVVQIPSRFVFSGIKSVAVVSDVYADIGQKKYRERIVFSAAVDEILPDDHAEAVAMVIPPEWLDFDVFSKRIETAFFCKLYIVNERVVARCGIQPVRPVSLIEQPRHEIRFAVEHKTVSAVLSRADGKLSHRKITPHLVLAAYDLERVESRCLGSPRSTIGAIESHGCAV